MADEKILVVDDEPRMCQFLKLVLSQNGYHVEVAEDGKKALELMGMQRFDVIITDLMMPEIGGMRILEEAKQDDPDACVIMITGYSTVETAIEAMKKGAYDYIPKPFKIDEIKLVVKRALEQRGIVAENKALRRQLSVTTLRFGQMIGESPAMQNVYRMIEKVARADSTVLIRGESGTGKELVARAIHYHSPRAGKPFVTINCAALPETLLESELFGHTKGAFTGAVAAKKGLFEEADGGTFFLDEVGEITLGLQAKLLRVLEEGEFMRLGETKPRRVNVRVLAATNRNLEKALADGTFRPELYYRLNVVTITLPPLRERDGDIALLATHFLARYSQKMGKRLEGFTPEAMSRLCRYSWPGNVRELENVIERAVILADGKMVDLCDLPKDLEGGGEPDIETQASSLGSLPYKEAVREFEKRLVLKALKDANGVQAKAAELLGLKRTTLHEIMKRLGIGADGTVVDAGSRAAGASCAS